MKRNESIIIIEDNVFKTLYQPIRFISFVKLNYRKFGNSTNLIIRNTHINSRGKIEEQLSHSSKHLIDNEDVRLVHKHEWKKSTIIQRKYKSYMYYLFLPLSLFKNSFYRLQVENPKRCRMQTIVWLFMLIFVESSLSATHMV